MSIEQQIRAGAKLAVFARNYRSHLEAAAKLAESNPERLVTFRSSKQWKSARLALQEQGILRVFLSPNGAEGAVEYQATLHTLLLDPQLYDVHTEKLLALCLDETKDEGLWGENHEQANTLYVISNCRRLEEPFSMTRLIKASDEKPISKSYGYSYTVVFDHIGPPPSDEFSIPEEVDSPQRYYEGATITRSVNAYERSAAARLKCLRYFGYDCAVCGFNFANAFGELGEGFIHVHHLQPLSEIDSEYEVDPLEDLRPVCPNCHAMLHKRDPAYSVEELRRIRLKSGSTE